MTMRRRMLGCGVLLTLALAPAHAKPPQQQNNDFYHMTSYGDLGVIADVHESANPTIDLLSEHQPNSITPRTVAHFAFNHFSTRADIANQPTYVAVLVFVAYSGKTLPDIPPLVLHRNSGWWRSTCYTDSCFVTEDHKFPVSDSGIEAKLSRDRRANAQGAVDDDLGYLFDGYPTPNADMDSWNNRSFWISSSNEAICSKPNTVCAIKYHLLKYVPTGTPSSQSPVDFFVPVGDRALAIAVYTRSGDPDEFHKHYTVTISAK